MLSSICKEQNTRCEGSYVWSSTIHLTGFPLHSLGIIFQRPCNNIHAWHIYPCSLVAQVGIIMILKLKKKLGPNKHINRSNRCPQHTNEQNSMMKYVGPKGRRRRRNIYIYIYLEPLFLTYIFFSQSLFLSIT